MGIESDMHFHLRRQGGAAHLTASTRRPLGTHSGQKFVALHCLKFTNYNCQSLSQQNTRLQEFCKDLHTRDIAGTRWLSAEPRSEWTVKNQRGCNVCP